MNAQATREICNILVDGAVEFMANKAGVTHAEILQTIASDPKGNTARYFASLIATGVANVDKILPNVGK